MLACAPPSAFFLGRAGCTDPARHCCILSFLPPYPSSLPLPSPACAFTAAVVRHPPRPRRGCKVVVPTGGLGVIRAPSSADPSPYHRSLATANNCLGVAPFLSPPCRSLVPLRAWPCQCCVAASVVATAPSASLVVPTASCSAHVAAPLAPFAPPCPSPSSACV